MRNVYGIVRKQRVFLCAAMAALMLLLTGCLHTSGDSNKDAWATNYDGSVSRVQNAMNAFQESNGILPIITAGPEVPKYEKFRIDLSKLEREGYVDDIPKTAFEKGGSAYFLVQNEEVDPIVKVMDLITVQKVTLVQRLVDSYYASHGTWPAKEEVYPNIHLVDTEAIQSSGNRIEDLASVYSGEILPYIIDAEGTVYADYAFDIMQLIDRKEIKPEVSEDLRKYLTEESHFVPVKSLPYAWSNGQPIAVLTLP
ncbi:hypothetical protein [Paenibacillus gallinarum]|uniref:ABC transporter substrate-binding protein n=1 Tax=Paenibacillus gallinarum TaxID=2762232 RepID=A0ABR8SX11_9BACL|nr:hypothetical protein [Paenibacillus gallinarum]MBD7968030.1 hypothetical protein [Paenibacillus gallinarum]